MSRPPVLRASFIEPDELVVVHFAGGGVRRRASRRARSRLRPRDQSLARGDRDAPRESPAHQALLRGRVEGRSRRGVSRATRGLAWFSPDCTFFSRAKGGKPRDKKVRALAWVVIRWARAVRPRVIVLENVPEFEDWGPLDENNMPDPKRAGLSFRIWLGKLRALGYQVEWRMLVAADYGAPTTRSACS
jgi:DNA (cytosine-5)-methyltransferase 1